VTTILTRLRRSTPHRSQHELGTQHITDSQIHTITPSTRISLLSTFIAIAQALNLRTERTLSHSALTLAASSSISIACGKCGVSTSVLKTSRPCLKSSLGCSSLALYSYV
jgi:hypothetical protein